MLVKGNVESCRMVGYPAAHGEIFQQVADQLDTVILGRAVGSACTGLIEEGYALKGFRIDTKSCDWGPMRGFVCADPRLNKEGLAKEAFNREYTGHAMSGHVNAEHTGYESMRGHLVAEWTAGHMPLIISALRVRELTASRHINPQTTETGHLIGESGHAGVRLRWRLVPIGQILPGSARGASGNVVVAGAFSKASNNAGDHYVLCVNSFAGKPWQEYVGSITPIFVVVGPHKFEVVQGLTNPGTESLGFKACVTGDYDLFGVWPKRTQVGRSARPSLHELQRGPIHRPNIPVHLPRVPHVSPDSRPLDRPGGKEHFQLGNISGRVNLVKVLLNTYLQSSTGGKFAGGQCVHHSDEVGNPNPALQKTLDQSMPVIAFVPSTVILRGAFAVDQVSDFYTFAVRCYQVGFHCELRRNWVPGFEAALAAAIRS